MDKFYIRNVEEFIFNIGVRNCGNCFIIMVEVFKGGVIMVKLLKL